MNVIQLANHLNHLPLATVDSEYILVVLNKFTGMVDKNGEPLVTVNTSGVDIVKAFNLATSAKQEALLENIFTEEDKLKMMDNILDQHRINDDLDEKIKFKWTSVTGSILIIALGLLLVVVWSFISQYATKPPVPDAVIGNLVSELLKAGVDALIDHATNGQ